MPAIDQCPNHTGASVSSKGQEHVHLSMLSRIKDEVIAVQSVQKDRVKQDDKSRVETASLAASLKRTMEVCTDKIVQAIENSTRDITANSTNSATNEDLQKLRIETFSPDQTNLHKSRLKVQKLLTDCPILSVRFQLLSSHQNPFSKKANFLKVSESYNTSSRVLATLLSIVLLTS